MPPLMEIHVEPPSVVLNTPPPRVPAYIVLGFAGSKAIAWRYATGGPIGVQVPEPAAACAATSSRKTHCASLRRSIREGVVLSERKSSAIYFDVPDVAGAADAPLQSSIPESSNCRLAKLGRISMRQGIRRSSCVSHTFTPPCHLRPPGASTISKPSVLMRRPAIEQGWPAIGRKITG